MQIAMLNDETCSPFIIFPQSGIHVQKQKNNAAVIKGTFNSKDALEDNGFSIDMKSN